jgi:hypothetical protein
MHVAVAAQPDGHGRKHLHQRAFRLSHDSRVVTDFVVSARSRWRLAAVLRRRLCTPGLAGPAPQK